MKKISIIIFSILIVLVISVGGYAKYKDYKVEQDIKKVTNVQNQKEESQVINEYNNLLSKYKNNGKIYSALSSYYVSKNKLDKAIDTLYVGLEQNKNNKLLVKELRQNIKNTVVQETYLRVTKGSTINGSDKIPVKTKNGNNIYLKLNIDNSKIDTSKEGFIDVQAKEKYTDVIINVGIEVLEFTGNTMANNLIGGKMAFNNGWIYFRDPESSGLYKMREDLRQKTQLDVNVEPYYINIKDNNIYFIDKKSGEYGSLVKTDLDGHNRQIIRQNTCYMYIVGDSIYYTEVKGEHSGWMTVSLNKMNFKYEDTEKNITINNGIIEVMNSQYIYSANKYGGFISSGKNNFTWGDANNYKSLSSAEIYKGDIYGNIDNAKVEQSGFGKLDIEHNTQNVTIENVSSFNCIGNSIYYVNDDGIFMSSFDGSSKVKVIDIDDEPYDISLYNIANKIYVYSDEIKIAEKQKEETAVNIPEIKNQDIINLCNNANKLLLDIQDKRSSNQFKDSFVVYASLDEPYTTKEKVRNELSKYFTKAYVQQFMEGSTFIEKDGKLYFAVGDSGMGASYTYTSIKNRNNSEENIQALAYAKYEFDNSTAQDGDIKLKFEDRKWKIDSFHSIFQ